MGIAEAYVSWVLLTLETISLSYEILWLHVSVTYVTHKELWDLMWNIVRTGLPKWIGARLKKWRSSEWEVLHIIFGSEDLPYVTWLNLPAAQPLYEMEIPIRLGHCPFVLPSWENLTHIHCPGDSFHEFWVLCLLYFYLFITHLFGDGSSGLDNYSDG